MKMINQREPMSSFKSAEEENDFPDGPSADRSELLFIESLVFVGLS